MEHMEALSLTGKAAVVTGGASGIGKAIADTFREAGAYVSVLDLSAGAAGQEAVIECDVTKDESVVKAFSLVEERHGRIDILVNSAGIAHVGSLLTTSAADLDRLYQVNVRGTYLTMREAVKRMEAARSGVVLNLASIAATVGLSDRFAYSMTKGAVLAMTLSVAKDYLGAGIRCNCISPARVHTPFVDGFLAKNYPGKEAEQMAKLATAQPIGRMGRPQEIANLALFLCSEAGSFITGADYPIDGGYLNLR
jgi:2-keto-3-deoxy-L-fuconate dehydrogenase